MVAMRRNVRQSVAKLGGEADLESRLGAMDFLSFLGRTFSDSIRVTFTALVYRTYVLPR